VTDPIALNCPSCLGRLQITRDIGRFTCRYCGAELAVTHHGDREASARVVLTGPDRLVFDGQEYASPDDMSPEARRAYEQILTSVLADRDRDGVPDILQAGGVQTAEQVPVALAGRRRLSLGGGLFSLLMGLFWCCVFPLIFILPPLFTDAGRCALATAQDHPQVIRELGEPIRPIFSFTFLFSQEGAITQEQYLIVLNGPKGVGFLRIGGYVDPTSEWLEVEFNKDGRAYAIYGGPLDCSAGPLR